MLVASRAHAFFLQLSASHCALVLPSTIVRRDSTSTYFASTIDVRVPGSLHRPTRRNGMLPRLICRRSLFAARPQSQPSNLPFPTRWISDLVPRVLLLLLLLLLLRLACLFLMNGPFDRRAKQEAKAQGSKSRRWLYLYRKMLRESLGKQ
ncbi:hypothetical protein LZ30DRAFT_409903 [Colletotrichum cereale]|nr:hypothetical protein LZ30DRAFT_409903 [Colletotrichum cereale]